MIEQLNQGVIVCRPALQADTEGVFELSSHIWEGGDYIPRVWQDWLADPAGLLGVAEMNGQVVGTFKLTRFKADEWYLEGLRVHPDAQGRGVAAHIHEYCIDTFRRMGRGVLRLVTGSYNIKVHHMCEQSGFKRIAEFIPYRAALLPGESSDFTLVAIGDVSSALDFVLANPTHAFSWGLINLGWVYADPQLKHIQEAIGESHAWWWKGGEGFLSIWEDEEDGGHDPGVQLIACQEDELPHLLLDYRRLVGMLGYSSAGWIAPNRTEVVSSLEKAGFQRSWDLSLYVYELRPD